MATLAVALATALAIVGGWERHWRRDGLRPSVNENASLWALVRSSLNESDPDEVVIIGSSRAIAGVHLDTLRKQWRCPPPKQLAIGANSPLPILRHLAEETQFRGTLVCGVTPNLFFNVRHRLEDEQLRGWDRSEEYLVAYRQWLNSPAQRSETYLSTALASRVVFRLPELRGLALVNRVRGRYDASQQTRYDASRNRMMDFRNYQEKPESDVRRILKQVRMRPVPDTDLPRLIEFAAGWIDTIERRGGRVILLRLPNTGANREATRIQFPRQRYWDALVERCGVPAIHYEDHAGLRDFRCGDQSHLDYRDAILFTERFARLAPRR